MHKTQARRGGTAGCGIAAYRRGNRGRRSRHRAHSEVPIIALLLQSQPLRPGPEAQEDTLGRPYTLHHHLTLAPARSRHVGFQEHRRDPIGFENFLLYLISQRVNSRVS